LQDRKVKVPVVAIGGERGLGARVGQFVSMVASEVSSQVLPGCGHFIPEERPDAVVDQVLRITALSGAVK
jgi:pimeloyl-ACP methyl ester carboxylesterase